MTREPPLVLIVEDEEDLQVTYERLLRRFGCAVVMTRTRREALAVLDERPRGLALVICDLRLADGDGIDVVSAACARAGGPPVVVVSGVAGADRRRAALDAGATAFVSKPFGMQEFSALVRRVLDRA